MHALTVIENVTVTRCRRLTNVAKGPEIDPRHRLVPAVGIMRLVAGQARLVRQWSFCCIGGTNVCLRVICVAGGMAWPRYASVTPMCLVCGLH